MGRPTKLDDLVTKRICDAIKKGVSLAAAAKSAGVGASTLHLWLAKGRDGESPYSEFLEQVDRADGVAHTWAASKLRELVEAGHPGATMYLLERRWPEDWGKRDSVTHEHRDAKPEDGAGDLDVARSVVAALESRKAVA